jgi:hypothetical protein
MTTKYPILIVAVLVVLMLPFSRKPTGWSDPGVLAFLALWSVVIGSQGYFAFYVAPTALREWAHYSGYRIVKHRHAGIRDWIKIARGRNSYRVYRVSVLDKAGQAHSGFARVGEPFWHCLSPSDCPVDISWDPPSEKNVLKPAPDAWTRDL